MKIHHDCRDIRAEPVSAEDLVEPGERVIERVHEEPAHQIDDEDTPPADAMHSPARTRRTPREVSRLQQTRVSVDIRDDLALIPDVVAGGEDVDTTVIELPAKALGQPEPRRCVFGVDHDE